MTTKLVKKIIPGPMTESLVGTSVEDEEMVCTMIQETLPQLEVIEVQTVKNSFLEGMYRLKKEEYKSRYGMVPEEKLLFHVTAASNINSIVSNNFDWRRISRGKFGLGTSFSGDAEYANRYANFNIGEERAIIVTKVLVAKITGGHNGMKIPRKKFDTATGNGDKVYVKFSDNEILPKYVVFYSSDFSQKSKKNKSNKKKYHANSKSPCHNNSRGDVFNNSSDYYDYKDGHYGEYEEEYYEEEECEDFEEEDCEEEEFCEEEEEFCEEEEEFCEDEEECEDEEDCDEEEYCEEEEYCDEEDYCEEEECCEEEEYCDEEEYCEEEENEYDDDECEEEYYDDEGEENEDDNNDEGYAVEYYDNEHGNDSYGY